MYRTPTQVDIEMMDGLKSALWCLTILMDFIEYHWIYQRSHAVQLRLYVVIHTIIELSLLQLIFRISLFVLLLLWAYSTNTCAPSLELDAYLVSAFVRYRVTPLPSKFNHCLVTSLHGDFLFTSLWSFLLNTFSAPHCLYNFLPSCLLCTLLLPMFTCQCRNIYML